MTSPVINAWHRMVSSRDPAGLPNLLADDAVFYSPVVYKPQAGKDLTLFYLHAAFQVLMNDSFHYVREIIGDHDAMLEFTVELDGITVNGVDIMRWNDDDQIIEFKVMLRPLKAINLVHQKMAEALQAAST